MGRQRLAKNRGFPPNLYLNSAGYFYYLDPDKKKTKGLGRDKATAFREARIANAVLATREPSALADWVSGKSDYTLAQWIPIYKELWIKKSEPAENTLRNASGYLERIIESPFSWMRLQAVGTVDVATWLDEAREKRGAPTAMLLRSRVSDVFRMAESQGLIKAGTNPISATYKPTQTVKRERLTIEQFWSIHAQAPIWLKNAMVLALLTAQRREDIAEMKFGDVKDGYLQIVPGKLQGAVRIQQDLKIRMDAVNMTIGDAVLACRDLIRQNYMVHHVKHTRKIKPGDKVDLTALSQGFQIARDSAGITAAEGRTPPSFHEIRSLSERLYREQYGPEFAQAMLGHKSAKMTSKYDDLRGSGWSTISAK